MNLFLMGVVGLLACGEKATDTSSTDTGEERTDTGEEVVSDADNDGVTVEDGDCDDNDDTVYPGANDDTVDGVDQNCDGFDGIDADGDGIASAESGGTDCDDDDASVGEPEDPQEDGFYLGANCYTVVFPGVEVGATGDVDGVTYTKVDRTALERIAKLQTMLSIPSIVKKHVPFYRY